MKTLFADLETFSEADLKKVGVHVYAAHPSTEITVFAYAIDDGPRKVWDLTRGDGIPDDLYAVLADTSVEICCHNSPFDRTVLLAKWPDWAPLLGIERWHCTMAQALTHSLPGALEKLGHVFKLPLDQRKIADSRRLVMLFCKPRGKTSKIRRATRHTHPKEWAEFLDYAGQDVVAMRELYQKLPRWNYPAIERELWQFDQRMNDRGFCVDTKLAKSVIHSMVRAKDSLTWRTLELTDNKLVSTTQRDNMLRHVLAEYGVALPDLRADTLERRMKDELLPDALRELLAIRLQASTTSTAKYQVFLNATGKDGRLRGTTQFCGASRTGRDAHRLVQPGNFPRPNLPSAEIAQGIEAFYSDSADLIVDNVMEMASNAIRGCIIAPEGRRLEVGDLANIEGRVGALLADEKWKLQAFRDYDTILGHDDEGEPIRKGPDLYKLAYANSFRVPISEATGQKRQIGKVQELMLQFQGGAGAYVTGAMTYGIDLSALADTVLPVIPPDVFDEAQNLWTWAVEKKRTLGLPQHIFVACDCLKRLWRRAHPAFCAHWSALSDAATSAIREPDRDFKINFVRFRRDGSWLRCVLPSGRSLCYPSPEVGDGGELSYLGVSQYTHQWTRIKTYGGKLFENCVQGIARDVLMGAVPVAEARGYEVVLKVHDELVCEVDDTDAYSNEELCAIMATPPEWAPGLPLAASGFTATRYGKG